jgi:hypothetical protein
MAVRETEEAAELRWAKLGLLREHYSDFSTFLDAVMRHIGFGTSWLQHDIAQFLQHGPAYLMIQAQRGQAKTTITAAYAVWALIMNPSLRVLIVSAAGGQASDISTLIVRIVLTMEELECMRPDQTNGDRTSTENFDVHYTLKGVDKSASIACMGVTGTLVGKRSDLLIADDIESPKNSATAVQREQLLHLTREFTSISATDREGAPSRIVYLGTPQSMESVYNTLPSRGFEVRIWPGRYPTPEQMKNYGDMLAPAILTRLKRDPNLIYGGGMLSDQGQPTDPELVSEAALQKKERDQGKAHFQLQYMLSTALSDAQRYPLKPENLIVMRMAGIKFPMSLTRAFGDSAIKRFAVHSHKFGMSMPLQVSEDLQPFQGIAMYVDPAGGGMNADENGYAVTGFLNGNVYLLDVGGFPGGYSQAGQQLLADVALKWRVNVVVIEKNMGFGAFREVWTPTLLRTWKCAIEDDLVVGQKEKRIISILEPIMGRGSLIVNEDIVEQDILLTSKYDAANRITYSFFHQLCKLTHSPGCLAHDDRLDAVAGAVNYWKQYLAIDEDKNEEEQRAKRMLEFLKDPRGRNRYTPNAPNPSATSVLNRFRRY